MTALTRHSGPGAIQYAVDYRRTVMGQDFDNCRLIFGESDGFPGLTVDRFGPILVAQVLSLGMELRKMQLFVLLLQALRAGGEQIDAIYERNDVKLRQKEGMEQGTRFRAARRTADGPGRTCDDPGKRDPV